MSVCDTCHSYFCCPTSNPWGPELGELITVCTLKTTGKGRKRRTELVQTNLQFEVIAGETTVVSGHEITMAQYPKKGLPCPECNAGTVHFGFEIGDRCPWCSKADLEFEPLIY